MSALVFVAMFVIAAAFVWSVIRSDERAERAQREWYDHPSHIWNQRP